ncbi:MAG: chorismate synthase [Acidobacteria bacterium]|nr:MAG: chorismate synthase [Acidobacteriota bacterium]
MFDFVTAGESHGKSLVAVISGLPLGLEVDFDSINRDLRRRQSGYGRGGRMKIESDHIEVVSGVRFGKTIGSPVAVMIHNRDWANWQESMSIESKEIPEEKIKKVTKPRPGHADLAGALKYNTKDIRNILERSSARETTVRVAVGGFAKVLLRHFGIEIASHTVSVGEVTLPDERKYQFEDLLAIRDNTEMRCIDSALEQRMIDAVKAAHLSGDTIGGAFEVIAHGVCPGLGSHTAWDRKIDGWLAQAIMSINAVKAVAVGAGQRGSQMLGSHLHDEIFYTREPGGFYRGSNNAGGIEGGMSNGCDILIRGYIKPIPTLRKPLKSVDILSKEAFDAAYERSDTCVVPAAGVIGEAMVAIILARAFLEKFGGDSLTETNRNFQGYLNQLANF